VCPAREGAEHREDLFGHRRVIRAEYNGGQGLDAGELDTEGGMQEQQVLWWPMKRAREVAATGEAQLAISVVGPAVKMASPSEIDHGEQRRRRRVAPERSDLGIIDERKISRTVRLT
jgi:hypothetical protein